MEFVLDLTAEISVVREALKAANMQDLDSLIDEKINQLLKRRFDRGNPQKQSAAAATAATPAASAGVITGQMTIQFLDKKVSKSKKKTGWFGQGKSSDAEDLNSWELWIIKVACLPLDLGPSSASSASTKAGKTSGREDNIEFTVQSFEQNIRKIIDLADKHKDHIPPITSLDSSPFPYIIEIGPKDSGSLSAPGEDESWGKYIKKILD